MILISNILIGLAQVLNGVLNVFLWVIIIRVVMSWFSPDPHNPIVRFITEVTEPLFRYVRRYVPNVGPLDLSPIILMLLIMFLQAAVVSTIVEYAVRMKA